MRLQTTTSQTVGPYFKIGMQWLDQNNLAAAAVPGERVTVQGRVLDGDGLPVPDAVLEIWQANSHGKYAHREDAQDKPLENGFTGFGRVPTDQDGVFRFATIKPGSVPGPNGVEQAPHLVISIFMRGLLKRLVTRMYFPDARTAVDPILHLVDPTRRMTLVAHATAGGAGVLEWNVVLQGAHETVFFDVGL
ncbi:MAG: protocatechuate 3,4-dioxygenase subunit alpha [Acidobacteria bacterium]|nr:protocatechuate 3,4-dioxygenase subunit alpha [Acidobacteriota bacterium]